MLRDGELRSSQVLTDSLRSDSRFDPVNSLIQSKIPSASFRGRGDLVDGFRRRFTDL